MKKMIMIVGVMMALMLGSVFATGEKFYLSDSSVTQNGVLMTTGSITLTIWNNAIGGTPIYSELFSNAIVNGSYSILAGKDGSLNLNFGQTYYYDMNIDGQDISFDGQDRREFRSPVGNIIDSKLSSNVPLKDGANTFSLLNTFNNGISVAGTTTLNGVGYTFPNNAGTSGYALTTNGAGILSWAEMSGGGTPAGNDKEIQYNNNGAFGGMTNLVYTTYYGYPAFLYSGSSSHIGVSNSAVIIDASGGASGLIASGSTTTLHGNVKLNLQTYTFPNNAGASGYALTTNGAGILSWTEMSGGGTPAGNDKEIQYNNNGAFGGVSELRYNPSSKVIGVGQSPTMTDSNFMAVFDGGDDNRRLKLENSRGMTMMGTFEDMMGSNIDILMRPNPDKFWEHFTIHTMGDTMTRVSFNVDGNERMAFTNTIYGTRIGGARNVTLGQNLELFVRDDNILSAQMGVGIGTTTLIANNKLTVDGRTFSQQGMQMQMYGGSGEIPNPVAGQIAMVTGTGLCWYNGTTWLKVSDNATC